MIDNFPTLPSDHIGEDVAVSSDGSLVALAFDLSPYLIVASLTTGEYVDTLPTIPFRVRAVAFSPNGDYLAVAVDASPGLMVIRTSDWSVVEGTPSASTSNGTGHKQIAFSPDGSYLAVSGGSAPWLVVVDTSDWSSVPAVESISELYNSRIGTVAFSPDSQYLAVGSLTGTRRLAVYDVSDWSTDFILDVNSLPAIESVDFSPNGLYLAASSRTAPCLWVYNVPSWTQVTGAPTFETSGVFPASVSFSPDNTHLALSQPSSGPRLYIYNVSDWSTQESARATGNTPQTGDIPRGFAWTPDNNYLLYAQAAQFGLVVFSRDTWEEAVRTRSFLVAGGSNTDATVSYWSPIGPNKWNTVDSRTFPTGNPTMQDALYNNGRWIIVGREAKILYVNQNEVVMHEAVFVGEPAEPLETVFFTVVNTGTALVTGSTHEVGIIYKSTNNGETWTKHENLFGHSVEGLGYGKGMLQAFGYTPGDTAAISYSYDGVNWESGSISASTTINSPCTIAYGSGMFVLATPLAASYSLDGITWHSLSGLGAMYRIRYINSKFFAFYRASSSNSFRVSEDGVTWSTHHNVGAHPDGRTIRLYDIAYDGEAYHIIGDLGWAWRSTDIENWEGYKTTGSTSVFYRTIASSYVPPPPPLSTPTDLQLVAAGGNRALVSWDWE